MSYNYTTINSGSGTWPIKVDKNALEEMRGLLRAFARREGTGGTYLYIVIAGYNLEEVITKLIKTYPPVKLTKKDIADQYYDQATNTSTIKIGFIPAIEFNGVLLEKNIYHPVEFQNGKVSLLLNTEEKKENNMLDNVINTNKQAAVQAGYLKAGRVANKALEATVRKRFPALPDTPFTGLVLANLVDVLGKQVKPSAELARVSGAMVTAAYLDMYDVLDLEGIVEELLASVPEAMKDDTVKVEA